MGTIYGTVDIQGHLISHDPGALNMIYNPITRRKKI
jgi:hypothetical protein